MKVNVYSSLRTAFIRVGYFVSELKSEKVELPLQGGYTQWTKSKTMEIQTQQFHEEMKDRAVSPIKVEDGGELLSEMPLQMPEQEIHTISSISGRTNSLSTIQEVSSARYHVDSIMHCQTFVEAENSNQQSQILLQNDNLEVIQSPTKQHHRQTPSISNIQELNPVQFPVSDYQGIHDRSRSSATFDYVQARSPPQESGEEIKETRFHNYIKVEQYNSYQDASQGYLDQMGFLVKTSQESLNQKEEEANIEEDQRKAEGQNQKREGESSSNLEFNISPSTQEEVSEAARYHPAERSPTSSAKFRQQLTERLRSHVQAQSGQGLQHLFNGHNALLSPQSQSARTSLVSNQTKGIVQRKLNFMREERSPKILHNGSELAQPIEITQVSTTPRYIASKSSSSNQTHRNEIVTPNSELRQTNRSKIKGRKYNHQKFLQAIASSCQKYAVEVLTLQKNEREEKEKHPINYSAQILRESILNDLRERRQRVMERSIQTELTRNSKEIKPPSYPKVLLEYSLSSLEKSSQENTPKRPKRHYSALALSQNNSQHLSLSQCSSKKSIPSIEIDLREDGENIKTEGWQDPEERMKQAEELARKILGFSSKSKYHSQQREARKQHKTFGKKIQRVHSQTMGNLRSHEGSVEQLSNYSQVITPKAGGSIESSYFFKQMKAKYLAERKKTENNESVNYIKRNIESLKKMKGEQGKKKILKCNH